MDDIETYDKAKYHTDGKFPKGLSPRQAYVHTGFFLGWLADKHLLSQETEEDFAADLHTYRDREISGPDLYARMGGGLDSGMLNEEGNAFAAAYFDFETGLFLQDYENLLVRKLPTFYHVADTPANYKKLATRIDQRYLEWKDGTLKRAPSN
jgi:hypothetical protein